MLFNSFEFVVFFIVVYAAYRRLPHRGQNLLLLASSYFFYGCWNWKFLGILWISTLIDYFCGLKIGTLKDPGKRKLFLSLSIGTNLCILGFFKYFNFFAQNLQELASFMGFHLDTVTLNIILPVGISFYTFQEISYIVDVYRGRLKPERNLLSYALFVVFFPHLVAGPIQRPSNLLPQITGKRTISPRQIDDGCWLIFLGFFKKVFIADNLALIVDAVFEKTGIFPGSTALIALYAFAFQIYGDFSGYSDIARGTAKLMGIELVINFKTPYLVTNPRDFWKHWHISLSTWLKDYLYIPLGGNRGGTFATIRNLFMTMLLGGLWHGAAWTFVIWGAFHGLLLTGQRILSPFFPHRPLRGKILTGLWTGIKIIFMFHLTCLGWLIFRSHSPHQIGNMLQNLFGNFLPGDPLTRRYGTQIVFFTAILIALELFEKKSGDPMVVFKWPAPVRWILFVAMFYLIAIWGEFGGKEFIYFQF